jgi:hypothetical protein
MGRPARPPRKAKGIRILAASQVGAGMPIVAAAGGVDISISTSSSTIGCNAQRRAVSTSAARWLSACA